MDQASVIIFFFFACGSQARGRGVVVLCSVGTGEKKKCTAQEEDEKG
jgi:hypothetical protein